MKTAAGCTETISSVQVSTKRLQPSSSYGVEYEVTTSANGQPPKVREGEAKPSVLGRAQGRLGELSGVGVAEQVHSSPLGSAPRQVHDVEVTSSSGRLASQPNEASACSCCWTSRASTDAGRTYVAVT